MGTLANILRVVVAAIIIVFTSELSKRYPRYGALLLSLPLVSILAFIMSWQQHRDMSNLSRMARETLILVPLGLPFFIPFAFAERWDLGFWSCMALGCCLASITIGIWLSLATPH